MLPYASCSRHPDAARAETAVNAQSRALAVVPDPELLLKLLLGCSVLRRATTFLVVAGEWVTFGKTPSMGGLVRAL